MSDSKSTTSSSSRIEAAKTFIVARFRAAPGPEVVRSALFEEFGAATGGSLATFLAAVAEMERAGLLFRRNTKIGYQGSVYALDVEWADPDEM
jgi:hypothetical protein